MWEWSLAEPGDFNERPKRLFGTRKFDEVAQRICEPWAWLNGAAAFQPRK